MAERHIVAMGGGGFSMEPRNPKLDDFVLSLARRKRRPRVCFVGTASGDSDSYIRRFHEAFPPSRAAATHLTFFERKVRDLKSFVMEQDVIYVGGGSSANMLAVWRLHGLDKVLRAAWNAGVVMAGISAGAICWFEDGLTDSFGMPFRGSQRRTRIRARRMLSALRWRERAAAGVDAIDQARIPVDARARRRRGGAFCRNAAQGSRFVAAESARDASRTETRCRSRDSYFGAILKCGQMRERRCR